MVPLSPFTKFRGLFLFNCNYHANDLRVSSLFYSQLLTWWSEFCEDFASPKDWHNTCIIWNNRIFVWTAVQCFIKISSLSCVVYIEGSPFKLQ